MEIHCYARTALIAAVLAILLAGGCRPSPKENGSDASAGPSEHSQSHDHGHDHGHSHDEGGPNGGHLVVVGDEQYHVEWLHDDETGLVTLYVLDADAAEPVRIAAESITVTTKVGDEEPRTYQVAAVDAGEAGASRFELKDPSLIEALKLAGQGVEATVVVPVDGSELIGTFEHHEHGDGHGHHH